MVVFFMKEDASTCAFPSSKLPAGVCWCLQYSIQAKSNGTSDLDQGCFLKMFPRHCRNEER